MWHKPFGKTELTVPPVVFGSAILGNLFQVTPYEAKLESIREIFKYIEKPIAIDTAGKYGAGLSLEVLGRCLRELGIIDHEVVISNKLGWRRTPLTTPEPTFEPGAWFGLDYDAVQDISYDGIIRCWEQGRELLGGEYSTQIVSVHDPDEYLDAATSASNRQQRFDDILAAYTALNELKAKGYVKAVGVGAKNWKVIQEIDAQVALDWVMFANSYTLYSHPIYLLRFMDELHDKQVAIINSAVFNAGFLTGGDFFNYRKLDPNDPDDQQKFAWREKFFELCHEHNLKASDVCIQFGKSHPGIVALALSTSKPERVKDNVAAVEVEIPVTFWKVLRDTGLITYNHPYLSVV
jgi:D-threo-aldose 1-dehydrogenase